MVGSEMLPTSRKSSHAIAFAMPILNTPNFVPLKDRLLLEYSEPQTPFCIVREDRLA